jgi:hypothetical protein
MLRARPAALAASLLVASFVALHPTPARAQVTVEPPITDPVPAPAPAPASPAAQPPPLVEAPPEPEPARGLTLNDLRYRDAHADRVVLGSTGETHPKGTFFFTDYEIFLIQLGYAITDDLQLSLAGFPPILKEQPYFFDLGLKLNIARGPSFRAALLGALDVVIDPKAHTEGAYGGRLGGVAQVCFEETCRSSVSFNAGGFVSSESGDVLPVYGSAGFILHVSPLVSLLGEPAVATLIGRGTDRIDSDAIFFVDYGLRLAGKNFGVDLTFIAPVATASGSSDNNPFILGYPFVAFTYRTDGELKRPGAQVAAGAMPAMTQAKMGTATAMGRGL